MAFSLIRDSTSAKVTKPVFVFFPVSSADGAAPMEPFVSRTCSVRAGGGGGGAGADKSAEVLIGTLSDPVAVFGTSGVSL